jgi:hypothetical protein
MLWLLDGALQLQPFMLGTGFANQIIAPAAGGQPQFVAAAVRWGARVIAAHPVASDVPFAATQLLIGLGLLVPRTARLALAASLPWSLGVWYFGEGLSGLASGHASLLTGAPGAVVLYGVLALAAWPTRDPTHDLPARWVPLAWALVWVGGAVFQVLPGQNTGPAVAAAITGGNDGAPGWLVRLDTSTAGWTTHNGRAVVITLATTEALIGLAVLHRRTRGPAVGAGLVLALATWVVCQHFGQLYSGQATDPNTAPVIALLALALPVGRRARVAAGASAAEKGTTDRAPQRARSSASVRTRKMSGARPTVDALSHKDSAMEHLWSQAGATSGNPRQPFRSA